MPLSSAMSAPILVSLQRSSAFPVAPTPMVVVQIVTSTGPSAIAAGSSTPAANGVPDASTAIRTTIDLVFMRHLPCESAAPPPFSTPGAAIDTL